MSWSWPFYYHISPHCNWAPSPVAEYLIFRRWWWKWWWKLSISFWKEYISQFVIKKGFTPLYLCLMSKNISVKWNNKQEYTFISLNRFSKLVICWNRSFCAKCLQFCIFRDFKETFLYDQHITSMLTEEKIVT